MLAGVAIAGLAAVAATTYICYRFAEPILARMHPKAEVIRWWFNVAGSRGLAAR
jgi:hypothetical protein